MKSNAPNNSVIMHTDGGCRGNPGIGGWGVFLSYQGHEKTLKGSEQDTTNNRMEMLAAIKGLEALKRPCQVTLISDSNYLRQGMTQWLEGWKKKGWKTANKKPVKNQDLWQRLDELNQKHDVQWQWVKGHNGDPGNERADALANEAMDELENV